MIGYSNLSQQELQDLMIAQIKELRTRDPAAARKERLTKSRQQLVDLRDKLTKLLNQQDWKQFRDVEKVISAYVLLLITYPFRRTEIWSDVSVDLNILKKLQAKLEYDYAEAKKNHYKVQCIFLHAVEHRAMMFHQLHILLKNPPCTLAPDKIRFFRKLLRRSDWKCMLKFVKRRKEVLLTQAKEKSEEVQFLEPTADTIDFDNLDQFKVYKKKEKEASSEMDENLDVYIHSLPVCKAVKDILSRLERMLLKPDVIKVKPMCSLKPDDDIKVDEECQEVHRSMQPDDGAKSLKRKCCSD